MSFAELLVLVPSAVGVLALLKRLSAFDLELRSHRAQKRRDLLRDLEELAEEREVAMRKAAAFAEIVAEELGFSPNDRRTPRRLRVARTDIPVAILLLLDPDDAMRCAQEWGAHLAERIADSELREARRDRRGLVRHALVLALTQRLRRVAQRSRLSGRRRS